MKVGCPIEGDEEYPCPVCKFYRMIWELYSERYNQLTCELAKGEISNAEYEKEVQKEWSEAVKKVLEYYPEYQRCPVLY